MNLSVEQVRKLKKIRKKFEKKQRYPFYIITPVGFEAVTVEELIDLGYDTNKNEISYLEDSGGVNLKASFADIPLLNQNLRIPIRILLRLGSFYASGFSELERKIKTVPFQLFISDIKGLKFHVTSKKSKLFHETAIKERLYKLFSSEILSAQTQNKIKTEQTLFIRINHNKCIISIDTSGEPLYKRNYRHLVSKAPLRENLAAGILKVCGWKPGENLLDPFCGSGVIPIEAALLSLKIPNQNRKFAFHQWKQFNFMIEQDRELIIKKNNIRLNIYGSDINSKMIEIAKTNAQNAKIDPLIQFTRNSFKNIDPPAKKGWIVTNLPYGKRVLKNENIALLLEQFCLFVREKFSSWKIVILSPDKKIIQNLPLKFKSLLMFDNGGIKTYLWFYDPKE